MIEAAIGLIAGFTGGFLTATWMMANNYKRKVENIETDKVLEYAAGKSLPNQDWDWPPNE